MAYIPEGLFGAGVGHDQACRCLCNNTEGLVISTKVNSEETAQRLHTAVGAERRRAAAESTRLSTAAWQSAALLERAARKSSSKPREARHGLCHATTLWEPRLGLYWKSWLANYAV